MSRRRWRALAIGLLLGATIALTAQSMAETQDRGVFPIVEAPTSDA